MAVHQFSPREVVVETDLYRAVFSSVGSRLISLKLKDYLTLDGEWVELLGADRSGLGLSLDGLSLDGYEFVPDREALSLVGGEQGEVVFRSQVNGAEVVKRIRFQGDRYRMDLRVSVLGASRYPKVGMGWVGGLASTESIEEDQSYAKVVTLAGGEVDNWDADDLGPDATVPSGKVSWAGLRTKYFVAALVPEEGRYDLGMAGSLDEASGVKRFEVEVITENKTDAVSFGVYIGPISYSLLRAQNRDLSGGFREIELDEFMDYGFTMVRPVMKPITILILRAFSALHHVVTNYGLVIVVFSILVKIVLFPLTHKSLEATVKMQELQPRMSALKEKHSDDKQKLNQEMMKLYKEHKVNPLGGCLPMVFQMPILFALFSVFRGSIELRQAGFMLWIDDLSKPDSLPVGGFEVHVLPLLMAVLMFLQQKMTMKDPKQAMMVYMMPVLMTWIFWQMSSGLVLYFTMFNLLTLVQQQVMEYTKGVLGTK